MTPHDADLTRDLQAAVRDAAQSRSALRLVGGDTKHFYGRAPEGRPLHLRGHAGIVEYDPSELVLIARAGTPLREVERVLAQQGQMLAFEPPHFGASATLGGAVAAGLSGPRRPHVGSVRDFVLGAKIINGRGEVLSFGGRVMKNVAGYDVSRLLAGSLGTLGVLLELALKVLPRPERETTLAFDMRAAEALARVNAWMGKPLPLSGSCYDGERLYVRLSGAGEALQAAHRQLGGEVVKDDDAFWQDLREQRHGFFAGDAPLWRLSLAPATPPLDLRGPWLYEWGGAQRWLRTRAPAREVRACVEAVGGHATVFRGGDRQDAFHPLPPALARLHRHVKQAFDPEGVLNPNRMYRL